MIRPTTPSNPSGRRSAVRHAGRAALVLVLVAGLGASSASAPVPGRSFGSTTGVRVRHTIGAETALARREAIAVAATVASRAALAREAAASSAIDSSRLDTALAALDLRVDEARRLLPVFTELVPATPLRHTPLPARVPAEAGRTGVLAAGGPGTSAPAPAPVQGQAAASDPAAVPPAATADLDPATVVPDAAATASATAGPDAVSPAPDTAAPDTGLPAPDAGIGAAGDPAAARLLAVTAEVDVLTDQLQDATRASQEAAARAAAEAAEAARRAEQAASLDAYPNGRIPADALCPLDFAPGQSLRCDAAEALTSLNAAFHERFGADMPLTDSYRSYDAQVRCAETKGDLCATPGTSNHGTGIAVDFGGRLSSFGTTEHGWLLEHAGEFGWELPAWAHPDGSKPEPWHWEYHP